MNQPQPKGRRNPPLFGLNGKVMSILSPHCHSRMFLLCTPGTMWCVPHGKASVLTGDDRAYLLNAAALKAGDCQRRLSPHSSSSGPCSPSLTRRCEPFHHRDSPARTRLAFSLSLSSLSSQSSRQQLKRRTRWLGYSRIGILVSLDKSQATPGALIHASGYIARPKDPEESATPYAVVEG